MPAGREERKSFRIMCVCTINAVIVKNKWIQDKIDLKFGNGILLPKLFWPTVRKNCSSDWEKLLKFEAECREFSKFLRSLEQFIQTVKG